MFWRSCLNGGEHRFQPRYSTVDPAWLKVAVEQGRAVQFKTLFKDEVYECDVCVHCGKIVKP